MLFVRSTSTNPYFNLATEEYFLKLSTDEVFILWVSEPSVIVGKHQNTLAELNYRYIVENKIKIARRLSGGGTVVHDLQNLNFTFISNGQPGKLVDFKKFVVPIVNYLNSLGIKAEIGLKNDIRVADKKISGNAEHVFKNRVLHHGTLLFNSDLKKLKEAIYVEPGKYIDKAVQSNRDIVSNIADHLKSKINFEEFISGLAESVLNQSLEIENHTLNSQEIAQIEMLVSTKYNTPEWIFGYSPAYRFKREADFYGQVWKIEMMVEKGKIVEATITINNKPSISIANNLSGKYHIYENVWQSLGNSMPSLDARELYSLVYLFF